MNYFLRFIFVLSFSSTLIAAPVTVNIGTDTRIFSSVHSIKDFRDAGVVKQGFDYSCGSGALATLLTYYFNDPVGEEIILQEILTSLNNDQEKLRQKEGLNLLDLKTVSERHGYKTKGMKLLPEYLLELKAPVIVYIKPRGHEHFAVLKGIVGNRVYLADPSSGNVRMPLYQFLDMWIKENETKGIIFIVERQDGQLINNSPLKTPSNPLTHPEMLTIRQMLEVGNPNIRFPLLTR